MRHDLLVTKLTCLLPNCHIHIRALVSQSKDEGWILGCHHFGNIAFSKLFDALRCLCALPLGAASVRCLCALPLGAASVRCLRALPLCAASMRSCCVNQDVQYRRARVKKICDLNFHPIYIAV